MRASGTARLGAIAQGLINDGLDGARASATFNAAAEAPVELLGIARRSSAVPTVLTALRTSRSLRTLQEQTIIEMQVPLVMRNYRYLRW